jgi:hypothetical protein
VSHKILIIFSLLLLICSITYSIVGLFLLETFDDSVLPSSLVYLSVGLLAICVTWELKSHAKQISDLKQQLSDARKPESGQL